MYPEAPVNWALAQRHVRVDEDEFVVVVITVDDLFFEPLQTWSLVGTDIQVLKADERSGRDSVCSASAVE